MFAARPAPPPARLLWPAFFGAVMLAWAGLFLMARAAALPEGAPPGLMASLCIAAGAADPLTLVAMWGLMAAAMMLPGFAPALATFRALPRAGGASALVAGYLAVWLAASGAGAAAQAALSRAALIGPGGESLSQPLSAALLLGAGLWQFGAVKAACLARCRHPLAFFLERWSPGPGAALRMGAGLGLHCLGCCWALMATAFVGGTMNLMWMGLATLVMAAEKLSGGRRLTRPLGAGLVAAGALVAAGMA
jgi:predicted metal-binding membrane protein